MQVDLVIVEQMYQTSLPLWRVGLVDKINHVKSWIYLIGHKGGANIHFK
jgi:hypothetical protein